MASAPPPRRLIVALTGATGIIYGIRLVERLKEADVETHLIVSKWAVRTMLHETPYTLPDVQRLASQVHAVGDLGASISSGSFLTMGMIIVPCSMRTLSAVSVGHGDNLIHRAADVVLKERRRLVLVPREAPLSDIHLENMLRLSRMGAIVFPPVPAFYHLPRTIDDVVDHTVARILDLFGIHLPGDRWDGQMIAGTASRTSGD